MNDSNNNIFNSNNITPSPQPDNTNRIDPFGINQVANQNKSTNTTINNANSILDTNNNTIQSQPNTTVNTNTVTPSLDFNSVYSNNTSTSIPNEVSQPNQILNNNISSQQNINLQTNDNMSPTQEISNNQPTSIPVSSVSNQNTVNQSQMQFNQNMNNNIPPQQSYNNYSINDEELLKAFIGNNYEKITTRPFNFAGFFFSTFYMFYRKMFGYALLVFLLNLIVLNLINNFIVTIAFNVVVGLLVNKVYLFYSNKKIAKIKLENADKDITELKNICSSKGGTSVGKIFLGFITELGIAFVILFVMMIIGIGSAFTQLFNPANWNITINDGSSTNDSSSSTSGTLVENVSVGGYSCFNSKCSVTIYDSNNNSSDYVLKSNNSDLFNTLGDYKDYIKLNIYYTQKGNERTIVDYKIYLKSNNEDLSNIKTESELRNKIGLYSIGTHTDSFTLTEIGTTGFGFDDDTSYTYTSYTFVDNKNIEYEMKYINSNGTLNLNEGNKYTVTFEVTEGTFDYEYTIKSVR